MSGYKLFASEYRGSIMKKQAKKDFGDATKEIARRWASMCEDGKKPYTERAEAYKRESKKELERALYVVEMERCSECGEIHPKMIKVNEVKVSEARVKVEVNEAKEVEPSQSAPIRPPPTHGALRQILSAPL
jgi:hypothetical protein